jgi:hypothetical protein
VSDQHARFQKRLVGSKPATDAVADWLRQLGYEVEVPDMRVAPTAAEHEDYADRGDILITDECGITERVEVKGISYAFTCAEDWPFKEVLVAQDNQIDRPGLWPLRAYVSVSPDLKHAACIPVATRPHWYLTTKRPRNTGNVETFYACPTNLVQFRKINSGGTP